MIEMRSGDAVFGLDFDSEVIFTGGLGGSVITSGTDSGIPERRLVKYKLTQLRTYWSVPS